MKATIQDICLDLLFVYIVWSWTLSAILRCGATTGTPSPVSQVTPPAAEAVTPRPSLYLDTSRYSSERFLGITTRNATGKQRRGSESVESGEISGNYHVVRGSNHRADKKFNSNEQLRVPLYKPGDIPGVDPVENEVIEHPKQPFPPVPGAGYIPPSAALEQDGPAPLTLRNDREEPRVEYVTADCFNNYMKITVQFNGSFEGLVYSSGYAYDSDCVYVNGSGQDKYEFSIRLNSCGTLGRPEFETSANEVPDRNHFMWNTITVQYNREIEADLDEHFQVTCEYGYEFRRTVTFPVVGVEKSTSSPYLVTLSPPQCYMEVRSGFGPSGGRLTGPVTVGDPLTLMIHMESDSTEFDVAVSSCYAHNGAKKRLQLIDANGCISKEQLMSPFRGTKNGGTGSSNHVALYAYFKAFRFTSSPALYIECDVHMCHGTCPAQRCHWKSLTKRSANRSLIKRNATSTSENVSLFQALQVLQEPMDAVSSSNTQTDEIPSGTLCLPSVALTAVISAILACLLLACVMCILLCLRMKRIKEAGDMPAMDNYMTSAYLHKQPTRKRL
ncbi:uncharacterized protein LOC129216495 [Uloborus diversus]|uniref:uncharacterized protein LOC129216495 n=1 Tax=Uloborus diversus TaxID=327109 RepID=UPI0024097206|nr:uncharacterized protein LOC129216495 [Uloborus diversus]